MFTFKKSERLCSKKDLECLYAKGKHKTCFPLKVYWRPNTFDGLYPVRVVITVPKRLFKKAVHRNRIKRQLREVYRLHKHILYEKLKTSGTQLDIGILYISKDFAEAEVLKEALLKAFEMIMG